MQRPRLSDSRTPRRYAQIRRDFSWDIPSQFNFAVDVVDRRARDADHAAVIWSTEQGTEGTLNYRELAHLSDRFGAALRATGIVKGDRVIIMLPRSAHWMVAMLGALKIGAVPVPCIEMLTARDLAHRLANAKATAIVCRTAHTGKFAADAQDGQVRFAVGGAPGWLDFDAAMVAAPCDFAPAVVEAEDPAVMYYTSGSTGHPKGVLHAARALFAWRHAADHWLDLTPADTIWCTADTGWSKAGTSILFGPMSRGATSFLYDGPFVPRERLRLLAHHRITVYCAPAAELYRVAQENLKAFDLSSLRRVVSAGEAVSPAVAEQWEAASGIRIDEAYGQTEVLMMALNFPGEGVRYGSMGLPAPGCDLAVVDAEGRRTAPFEEGDLALLTPNPQIMLGYWGEPERTQACFREGPEGRWYVTGDRACSDADGYLWHRGRADDVINSAGYRIGPVEVENVLMEHPAVAACAVVGSPDAERGEIVKAFVVLKDGYKPSLDLKRALQSHAKRLTAPYKYPRAIDFIDALPVGLTGKILRHQLRTRSPAIPEESE